MNRPYGSAGAGILQGPFMNGPPFPYAVSVWWDAHKMYDTKLQKPLYKSKNPC